MRAPPLAVASTTIDDVGERGDDAVAHREAPAAAACTPKPDSLTSSPARRTRSNSAPWRRGYTTSRPVADHADDRAAGVERALVRGGVDADRQPAHHGDAGAGEQRAELAGVGEPVRRGRPGADDRDPRPVEARRARRPPQQHRRAGRGARRRGSGSRARRRRAMTCLRRPSVRAQVEPAARRLGPPPRRGGASASPSRRRVVGRAARRARRRARPRASAAVGSVQRSSSAPQPRRAHVGKAGERRGRHLGRTRRAGRSPATVLTGRPGGARPPTATCASPMTRSRRRGRRACGRPAGPAPRRGRSGGAASTTPSPRVGRLRRRAGRWRRARPPGRGRCAATAGRA